MSSPASALSDQVDICTRQCRARCCRYITLTVPAPRGHSDWDEVRWWLAHAGSMVTKDEDGWMLHMATPCRHLQKDNLCAVYASRPTTCSAYEAEYCEFTDDIQYDVELHMEADLAPYLEKKKLKRGAEVAQAIRTAARLHPESKDG